MHHRARELAADDRSLSWSSIPARLSRSGPDSRSTAAKARPPATFGHVSIGRSWKTWNRRFSRFALSTPSCVTSKGERTSEAPSRSHGRSHSARP